METSVNSKCKAFTSLEQSKKLAKILPIESADMRYQAHYDNKNNLKYIPRFVSTIIPLKADIPCWSLTALLNILPNEIITDNRFECHYQIHIRKYDGGDNTTLHQITYGNNRGLSGSWHDMINTGEKESLVDCCVQMIIKLNELKML